MVFWLKSITRRCCSVKSRHRHSLFKYRIFSCLPTRMKFYCNIILIITVNLAKICIPLNSYYSAIPELDNKIGTSHLLQETSASSSSVCGAMCRNNCNCFGYNPLQKRCRIHVFCIDMITTATGWQYYRAGKKWTLSLFVFVSSFYLLNKREEDTVLNVQIH